MNFVSALPAPPLKQHSNETAPRDLLPHVSSSHVIILCFQEAFPLFATLVVIAAHHIRAILYQCIWFRYHISHADAAHRMGSLSPGFREIPKEYLAASSQPHAMHNGHPTKTLGLQSRTAICTDVSLLRFN